MRNELVQQDRTDSNRPTAGNHRLPAATVKGGRDQLGQQYPPTDLWRFFDLRAINSSGEETRDRHIELLRRLPLVQVHGTCRSLNVSGM
jgi:hypothetical protein